MPLYTWRCPRRISAVSGTLVLQLVSLFLQVAGLVILLVVFHFLK